MMMRRSYFHEATINAVGLLITSISLIHGANAQIINTPCSSAMLVTTFTPCLNYVTGSIGTRSSPTQDCCASLTSLLTDNMDCVCLIVTGNVPVSIPFINAAISLPRMCKNSMPPFQCKAIGVPLPPPGPALFGSTVPTPAPASAPTPTPTRAHFLSPHSHSPKVFLTGSYHAFMGSMASKVAVAAVLAPKPAASLESSGSAPEAQNPGPLGPITNPGIRPVVKPNIASSSLSAFPSLFLIFLGIFASSKNILIM